MNRTTKLAKETELIRFFVKPIGLDPNGNNFIHRAASLGHIKLLKNIVKNIEQFCPDPDFLAQILNIKNGNGETALHLAIKKATNRSAKKIKSYNQVKFKPGLKLKESCNKTKKPKK